MRIESKTQMYELYHAGKFGNMLQAWRTLDEYLESGYDKPVVLRYRGDHGGAWCAYGVEPGKVEETLETWKGARRGLVTVNEFADDSLLTLQGEVSREACGLYARLSEVPKPMRQALSECQCHLTGLAAKLKLQAAMDPASWENLNELLDDYAGAVVEFSTWSKSVGNLKRNTVFWEVRHY